MRCEVKWSGQKQITRYAIEWILFPVHIRIPKIYEIVHVFKVRTYDDIHSRPFIRNIKMKETKIIMCKMKLLFEAKRVNKFFIELHSMWKIFQTKIQTFRKTFCFLLFCMDWILLKVVIIGSCSKSCSVI